MNKIIYIALLSLLTLTSCYKDKGSYDYKPTNDILISGIKENYEVNVGEHLLIKPELEFKLEKNSNVSYRWRIDTVVISDSSILDIEANFRVKANYYGDFAVIDNETGVAYMKSFQLSVSSKYRSGWLLLNEKNGAAQLDYVTEDRELLEDMYYKLNDKRLPVSCKRIAEDMARSWNETALGQVVILSDEGVDKSVILDGASFVQVVSLDEEFMDGKAPAGLIPMAYATSGYFRYIVDQDGKVYSKYSQKGLFQEGAFNQFPVSGNYKVLPLICETWNAPIMASGVLMFDVSDPEKGYQYRYAFEDNVVAYDTTKDAPRKFDLIGMDKKVLAMGANNDLGSGRNAMSIFLKSIRENKYFVHSLKFGLTWGSTPYMKSNYETEFPDPSIVDENSVFAIEHGRERIYIGTGSKLYMYDMVTGEQEETSGYEGKTKSITPLYDFGEGKIIRSMSFGYEVDRGIFELGVVVENGNRGDFYLMDVSSEGVSKPWNCAIFKSFEGALGRPHQVLYKVGDPWRFN